jgi:hypothetical protein
MPLLGRQNRKKNGDGSARADNEILNRRRDFSRCSKLRPKRQNQTMAELICQPRGFQSRSAPPFKDAENGKGYR